MQPPRRLPAPDTKKRPTIPTNGPAKVVDFKKHQETRDRAVEDRIIAKLRQAGLSDEDLKEG